MGFLYNECALSRHIVAKCLEKFIKWTRQFVKIKQNNLIIVSSSSFSEYHQHSLSKVNYIICYLLRISLIINIVLVSHQINHLGIAKIWNVCEMITFHILFQYNIWIKWFIYFFIKKYSFTFCICYNMKHSKNIILIIL